MLDLSRLISGKNKAAIRWPKNPETKPGWRCCHSQQSSRIPLWHHKRLLLERDLFILLFLSEQWDGPCAISKHLAGRQFTNMAETVVHFVKSQKPSSRTISKICTIWNHKYKVGQLNLKESRLCQSDFSQLHEITKTSYHVNALVNSNLQPWKIIIIK